MKVQVQYKICKYTVKDGGSKCTVKYIYSTEWGTVHKIGTNTGKRLDFKQDSFWVHAN